MISKAEQHNIDAVRQDPRNILLINNPSEELQLIAVSESGSLLNTLIVRGVEPSEAVQLAAVGNFGDALEMIDNPSEAVQLAAVTNNGDAVVHLRDKNIKPSKAVQLAAVRQNGNAIYYLDWFETDEDVQMAAVQQKPTAIKWISKVQPSVQIAAVRADPYSITTIKQVAPELWNDKAAKSAVIKQLIVSIKQSYLGTLYSLLNHLKEQNCPWPELEVIDKQLKANNA